MAKDAASKMRRTILVSALGGIVAVSTCIAVTGVTVEGMKANAVTAMAQRAEQDTQPSDVSQQPSGSSASSSSASQGNADDKQGSSSSPSTSSSDSGTKPDEGGSQGHGGDGSSSAGGTQGSENGTGGSEGDGREAPSTGVEVVGKGSYNGAEVYLIKWGDTLSYISAETGVSVDALANYNGIDDVDLIYADSAIQIPDSPDGKR